MFQLAAAYYMFGGRQLGTALVNALIYVQASYSDAYIIRKIDSSSRRPAHHHMGMAASFERATG